MVINNIHENIFKEKVKGEKKNKYKLHCHS